MPKVVDKATGDTISEQPYTEEGQRRASTIAESNPSWDVTFAPGGMADAASRVESYQLGGLIPGQPGFGERPLKPLVPSVPIEPLVDVDDVSPEIVPPLPSPSSRPLSPYKKGGKVKKY